MTDQSGTMPGLILIAPAGPDPAAQLAGLESAFGDGTAGYGIDAVLIGPYDLSASLGKPGEVNHPLVLSAIERVTSVCQRAGVPLGVFGVSAEAVKPYIKRGYTLIVAGVDTVMLDEAARQLLARVKT